MNTASVHAYAQIHISKPANSNFSLRKWETPDFACGFWFSVLCLIPFKGVVKVLLLCSITQGFKTKQKKNPQTKKDNKQLSTLNYIKWKNYKSIEIQKSTVFLQLYPHAFFLPTLVCLRPNQNWSERYGTLSTSLQWIGPLAGLSSVH